MQNYRKKHGFVGLGVFILLIFGLIGLYYGYEWYSQRYYIRLYDGGMVRYIDIPPFAERKGPAENDLIGECVLSINTSDEQYCQFFKSMSNRYGYLCNISEYALTIEVRKNYIISGEFAKGQLKLTWTPVLGDKLQKKAQAVAAKKTTSP
jgi:hypothetical protein